MMWRTRIFMFFPAFLFFSLLPGVYGLCPWSLEGAWADGAGVTVELDPGDEAPGSFGYHIDMRTEIGDKLRFKQDDEVRPDEAVDGRITVIWGDLIVDGQVSGDVTVILGELSVDGSVGGDATAIWGDLELLEHASIKGNAVSVGGKLKINPDATVGGERAEHARFLERIRPAVILRGGAGLGAFAWAVTWILFLGLAFPVLRVMPGQVEAATRALRERRFRSFWIGVPVAVAAIVLPLAFLHSYAGFPAGFILFVVALALYAFGRVVVASLLGGWILDRLHLSRAGGFRETALGYTVVRLVEVVPVLGGSVKIVLVSVSFGCVTIALWRWIWVRWITRKR